MHRERQRHDGKAGFGLLGVILLISFLSISAVGVYVSRQPSIEERAVLVTEERSEILQDAIARYRDHHAGAAPADLADLVTAAAPACAADTDDLSPTYRSLQGWCGPYVDRPVAADTNSFKTDGWGTTFDYDGVNLTSCGPNKACGDADDLSDAI